MPAIKLEGYFDCSSPFAYMGFHHMQAVAQRLGVTVEWKPILVGGVFNQVNPAVYARREALMNRGENPAKWRQGLKDFKDWGRYLGITVNFPPACGHPVNSARCMRACIAVESQGRMLDLASAGFDALWVKGLDLAKDEVLVGVCEAAGVDPDFVLQAIQTPAVKDALRRNTDELIARGGYGTPTFFVGGDDMYFGNDRVILVEAAIRRAQEAAKSLAGETRDA